METVKKVKTGIFLIVMSFIPAATLVLLLPPLKIWQWAAILVCTMLYERLLEVGLDFFFGYETEAKNDQP